MRNTRSGSGADSRAANRVATDIKAIVQFKQESKETWKEITHLSSISRSGCSFNLTQPCPVGRLVTMVTPMPTEFRAYDLNEEVYPVIGLVQHCYEVTNDDQKTYRLGVAFVGKSFPESYEVDPLQNYHICGTTSSGMWKITESGKKFHVRNAPRFWVSLPVTLTLIQKEKRSHQKEETVTANISATGVSVLSTLHVKIGDRLKFASKKLDFYTIGVVRNRRTRADKHSIVHLEFVDNRFPIEKLPVQEVTAVTDHETDDLPTLVASYPGSEPSFTVL